jgi:hypothetical protein
MIKNYEGSGLTIQQAMMIESRTLGRAPKDIAIRWGDHQIKTFDWVSVPKTGQITVSLISYDSKARQAVDIRVMGGAIALSDSDHVAVLRTWADPEYEDVMVYPFHCSGEMCVSTATETRLPNGAIEVERFTGNSGFWVKERGKIREYHASYASAPTPNFESFVFSVQIQSS